ncbi:MAG: class I SAM-dependent methyltransferase [Candidatus Omnitrophota bacterium]
MVIRLENIPCPLCGSHQSSLEATVRDYEYRASGDIFKYNKCENCQLVYLDPRPVFEDLMYAYPAGYEQHSSGMSGYSLKRFTQYLRARFMLRPRMRRIMGYFQNKKNLKVLDIGCGNGQALLAIRELRKDSELHGVDHSDSQSSYLKERGIIFHEGAFESLDFEESSYDIIILMHVIEHFINPLSVMEKVRRLLKEDGLIYLETHTSGCIEQRLCGPYWIGYDAPRHITVFNDASLRRLLSLTGYSLIRYSDRTISIGDIIYSMRRYCMSKHPGRLMDFLISDRNPLFVSLSVAANAIRLLLIPSSVAAIVARKRGAE